MTASPLPPGATSTPLLRSRAVALLALACVAAFGWNPAPASASGADSATVAGQALVAAPVVAGAPAVVAAPALPASPVVAAAPAVAIASALATAPAVPRAPQLAQTARACAPTGAIRGGRASVLRGERRVLCLINRTRVRFGLHPLRANRCLHRVAARHAHDMVARRYFAHTTPNGWDTGARAQASGYAPRTGRWIVGENIAWGVAGAARPAWVMQAWMHSPGHRANILNPRFRDAGVGIVTGTPLPRFNRWPLRATFSVDFGAHSGRSQCNAGASRVSRRPQRSSARARRHRHARSARSRSPR
jgi:uncharacterized protein YkwD